MRKYLFCNQGDGKGRLVRDQEVGGSNPLAPTNSFLKISYLEIPRFVPKSAGNSVALFLPFSCNGPLGSHGGLPFIRVESIPSARGPGSLLNFNVRCPPARLKYGPRLQRRTNGSNVINDQRA